MRLDIVVGSCESGRGEFGTAEREGAGVAVGRGGVIGINEVDALAYASLQGGRRYLSAEPRTFPPSPQDVPRIPA